MILFEKAGLNRLAKFKTNLTESAKTNNVNVENMKSTLIDLIDIILNNNNLEYIQNNASDLLDRFKRMDDFSGTFTPTVCAESTNIVLAYQFLLLDIMKNWEICITLAARIRIKLKINIPQLLGYACKFMHLQLNGFDNNGFVKRNEAEMSHFKVSYGQSILELMQIISNGESIQNQAQEVFLPLYTKAAEFPMLYRTELFKDLVQIEIDLNKALLGQNKKPQFWFITSKLKVDINSVEIEQLDNRLKKAIERLVFNLSEYEKSGGDKNKTRLSSLLRGFITLTKNENLDSIDLFLKIKQELEKKQCEHYQLLIRINLFSGELGNLLDEAVIAFNKLEETISLENNRSLARLVCENLELIEEAELKNGAHVQLSH